MAEIINNCASAVDNYNKAFSNTSEACTPKKGEDFNAAKCQTAVKDLKSAQAYVDYYCSSRTKLPQN